MITKRTEDKDDNDDDDKDEDENEIEDQQWERLWVKERRQKKEKAKNNKRLER